MVGLFSISLSVLCIFDEPLMPLLYFSSLEIDIFADFFLSPWWVVLYLSFFLCFFDQPLLLLHFHTQAFNCNTLLPLLYFSRFWLLIFSRWCGCSVSLISLCCCSIFWSKPLAHLSHSALQNSEVVFQFLFFSLVNYLYYTYIFVNF